MTLNVILLTGNQLDTIFQNLQTAPSEHQVFVHVETLHEYIIKHVKLSLIFNAPPEKKHHLFTHQSSHLQTLAPSLLETSYAD